MTPLHYEMIQELSQVEEGLSEWEVDFVENLSHKHKKDPLTRKQIEVLERLHEKKAL